MIAVGAFLADARPHAIQFANVQKPIGENPLSDDADAIRQAEQGHELGLQSVGKPGIGLGRHFHRIEPARLADTNTVPFSRSICTPTSSSRSVTAIR